MLCSISTHKSAGSNWLDRLRSSKGFEDSNEVTGSESSYDTVRTLIKPVLQLDQTPGASDNSGENEELCSVVTNVLSELFCMGESTTFPKFKRGSRKQTNPRSCAPAGINKRKEETDSVDKCGVEVKDSQVKLLEQRDNLNLAEEEEKLNSNLMGFSRTEVMVIDTSCAPWKFEKLLFRKKNVWKVRDKKSKTMNLGKKKKRKADVTNEDAGGEKKQKVISGHDGYERLQVNDKLEETCKRTSEFVGQASKKKQGNLKLKKASSSVVLIKSIPTSKKNGTGITKNFLKPSHRQYQAQ